MWTWNNVDAKLCLVPTQAVNQQKMMADFQQHHFPYLWARLGTPDSVTRFEKF